MSGNLVNSLSESLDSIVGVSGSLGYVTIILTLAAGYALKHALFPGMNAASVTPHNPDDDEEEEQPDPPRNFTPSQLREFDGKPDKDGEPKPVYLALNGTVFDVSQGRNFYGPDGPYEKFAGHECGVALAKMSFDEVHLDDYEGCQTLNFGEKTELDGWMEKFQYYRNYPIVGRVVPTTKLPPRDKKWTLQEMQQANKKNQEKIPDGYAAAPIYIAVKGKVYDMSFGGVTFYGPGGPYARFAGRDATRALAKMSLDEADLDPPGSDDIVSQLSEKEVKILDDWIRKFEQVKGYPVVGTL